MKVAIIVRCYPTLSETFIRRQVDRLGAHVICEKWDRALYTQLGLTAPVLELGTPPGNLIKRTARKLGWYYDYWSSRQEGRVGQYLAAQQVDVILAHFGPNAIKVANVCRRRKLPLFVHLHGYDGSGLLRNRAYRKALSQTMADAAGTVVVSEVMKDRVLRITTEGAPVRTIPCGVDVGRHDPQLNPPNRPCNFLAVGRLVEKKGPLLTVEAFDRCADEVEDVRLEIIGDGPLSGPLARYVSVSRHGQQIRLSGACMHEEVKAALARSDVFVQHSITTKNGDTEGWPISIAEAAACAIPVVSTRHAGIPMQVIDGKTGFLVEEGDVRTMAQRMVCLARDYRLRRRMGLAARVHIAKYGRLEDSVNRLKAFMEERVDTRFAHTGTARRVEQA